MRLFLDKQLYKMPTSFFQVESNFFPSFPARTSQRVSVGIFLCFVSHLFPYFTIISEASLSEPFRLDSSSSVSCHQKRINPQMFGNSEQLKPQTIHSVTIGGGSTESSRIMARRSPPEQASLIPFLCRQSVPVRFKPVIADEQRVIPLVEARVYAGRCHQQ